MPVIIRKADRPNSNARLYTYRWHQARKYYIRDHPLCVQCMAEDRITATFAVDHIIPHRGNLRLFWDTSNWQSLCESHHNAKSNSERQ